MIKSISLNALQHTLQMLASAQLKGQGWDKTSHSSFVDEEQDNMRGLP